MRAVVLLGWFFVVSYGQTTKLDFYTRTACEAARTETVNQLGQISAANAKRVSASCREDLAPPITATFTLDGTFDGKITNPK